MSEVEITVFIMMALPVDVVFFHMGERRHPQARFQQGSNDALLPHRLAGLRRKGRFLGEQGLTCERVGHCPSATGVSPHDIRTEIGAHMRTDMGSWRPAGHPCAQASWGAG